MGEIAERIVEAMSAMSNAWKNLPDEALNKCSTKFMRNMFQSSSGGNMDKTWQENKNRLLELLKERAVLKGEFKLASGGASNFYIDTKLVSFNSEAVSLIGDVIRSLIVDMLSELFDRSVLDKFIEATAEDQIVPFKVITDAQNSDFQFSRFYQIQAVGGPELGAIPIVVATVLAYHRAGEQIEGFVIRKESKDHGIQNRVAGRLKKGDRVVMLEDVLTTGRSVLKSIEAVTDAGARVMGVIGLVDRLAGAKETLAAYPCRSVFTLRDFGIE